MLLCKRLIKSPYFENFIMFVILLNSVLIGVQIKNNHPYIEIIQMVALTIFTIEIFIRFTGSETIKSYFSDGWNIFDIILVSIAYIPESLFEDQSLLVAFRVLRVFRVLRLLKAFPEIRLILSVLSKSLSALTYNAFISCGYNFSAYIAIYKFANFHIMLMLIFYPLNSFFCH